MQVAPPKQQENSTIAASQLPGWAGDTEAGDADQTASSEFPESSLDGMADVSLEDSPTPETAPSLPECEMGSIDLGEEVDPVEEVADDLPCEGTRLELAWMRG